MRKLERGLIILMVMSIVMLTTRDLLLPQMGPLPELMGCMLFFIFVAYALYAFFTEIPPKKLKKLKAEFVLYPRKKSLIGRILLMAAAALFSILAVALDVALELRISLFICGDLLLLVGVGEQVKTLMRMLCAKPQKHRRLLDFLYSHAVYV